MFERELLSALLDKYERSSFFREGSEPTRRIMLTLYDGGKTDFPLYDIENTEKRTLINRAAAALSGEDLVSFQWMKGEKNHIISRLWLNYENIANAYIFLGRKPAAETSGDLSRELQDALQKTHSDWARHFLSDCLEAVCKKRGATNKLPFDKQERADLLRAICFIDTMNSNGILDDGELPQRVFSLQCFGDTKRFEKNVRTRLVHILAKYYNDGENDSAAEAETEEALLRGIGIAAYPEQFEFCGKLRITFTDCPIGNMANSANSAIDFSALQFGSVIYAADLRRGAIQIDPAVTTILSIENRANFIDYIARQKKPNELVLFHGGQFSPAKGLFFKTLAAALPPDCSWQHWSDIDYGGFSMLARLRREIKADIKPYRMNTAELKRYANLCAPTQKPYIEKLKSLASRPELADCGECIAYMIENHIRLEQEAMMT